MLNRLCRKKILEIVGYIFERMRRAVLRAAMIARVVSVDRCEVAEALGQRSKVLGRTEQPMENNDRFFPRTCVFVEIQHRGIEKSSGSARNILYCLTSPDTLPHVCYGTFFRKQILDELAIARPRQRTRSADARQRQKMARVIFDR